MSSLTTTSQLLSAVRVARQLAEYVSDRAQLLRVVYTGIYNKRILDVNVLKALPTVSSQLNMGFIAKLLSDATKSEYYFTPASHATVGDFFYFLYSGCLFRYRAQQEGLPEVPMPLVRAFTLPGFVSIPPIELDDVPRARLYVSISPSQAAWCLNQLASVLILSNRTRGIKVLANPRHYSRADACVIYMTKAESTEVIELLKYSINSYSIKLRNITPLGTLQIGAGIGYAESPSTDESTSFGQWISELVVRVALSQSADGDLAVLTEKANLAGRSLESIYQSSPKNWPT
ncbi:hypothetical protein IT575_05135 [bacterium]|nr:hypothetical protein [bacterium]